MLRCDNGSAALAPQREEHELKPGSAMRLVPENTTLVIAGAWNPAILTPAWMLQYGLRRDPGEQHTVQVSMPAGMGLAFDFARYELQDFSYTARGDALVLMPAGAQPDGLRLLEDVGASILGELPHTPVSGVGHNFEFKDDDPDPAWLNLFANSQQDLVDVLPADANSVAQTLSSSLEFGNVIVNIQRYFDGRHLGVKFNFHHAIQAPGQGIRVLRAEDGYRRFADNFEFAMNMVRDLYGRVDV
jgi:hypothetical protein